MADLRTTADVVIVGAGPAGAALGLRLVGSGYSVVLVDQSRFDQTKPGESLAPAARPLLARLGIWEQFESLNPLPSYGTRSVWGGRAVRTHCHLQGAYNNGWHVNRQQTDAMLVRIAEEAGASLYAQTKVTALEYQQRRWSLSLVSADGAGRQVDARVLIDATGRAASIGRRLGARRILLDRLVAVCHQYRSEQAHEERHILLETCADGWWYSAPVSETRMMLMLMTDADLCRRRRVRADWHGLLEQTAVTARRLTKLKTTPAGRPWIVSAVSQRLSRPSDLRPWLATGDAALAVDPISGSGFVRALEGAEHTATYIDNLLRAADQNSVVREHDDHWDQQCTRYLIERSGYYAAEQRWQGHPFWDRRQVAQRPPVASKQDAVSLALS